MLRVLYLVGLVRAVGGEGWVEHPEDPGSPYPSIWATPVIKMLCKWGVRLSLFDQCRFGACARKPTCIMSTSALLHSRLHNARCLGDHVHAQTAGPRPGGGFHSTAHARYREELCCELAEAALQSKGEKALGALGAQAWRAEWAGLLLPLEHSSLEGEVRVYTTTSGFQQ